MTGRRACDEVTFGEDPSECLTTSGYSQLSQARLYPSSARITSRSRFLPSIQRSGTASRPLVLGVRPGRAPSPQPPSPRTSSATSLPPQRQQPSRSDRPVAAKRGSQGRDRDGVCFPLAQAPTRPHESLHSGAASQFLQKKVRGPAQGRCPAHQRTGPARH